MMASSALIGGVILAMIEGVGVLTTRWMGSMVDPTAPPVRFVFLIVIIQYFSLMSWKILGIFHHKSSLNLV